MSIEKSYKILLDEQRIIGLLSRKTCRSVFVDYMFKNIEFRDIPEFMLYTWNNYREYLPPEIFYSLIFKLADQSMKHGEFSREELYKSTIKDILMIFERADREDFVFYALKYLVDYDSSLIISDRISYDWVFREILISFARLLKNHFTETVEFINENEYIATEAKTRKYTFRNPIVYYIPILFEENGSINENAVDTVSKSLVRKNVFPGIKEFDDFLSLCKIILLKRNTDDTSLEEIFKPDFHISDENLDISNLKELFESFFCKIIENIDADHIPDYSGFYKWLSENTNQNCQNKEKLQNIATLLRFRATTSSISGGSSVEYMKIILKELGE